MDTSSTSYTTASRNCQHLAGSPTRRLNDRQILAKLHARGVRFVRFSKAKIAFDKRHRTWGLTLDALLRTYDDPSLLVGWIPASVLATCLDVDSGDWRRLVELYPPAYHNASRTPGRRHLVYRDTEPRPDINGWQAAGCHGDVRSAGPVILYDARRLLAALDMGLQGERFPPSTFRTHPQQMDEDPETKVHSQQEQSTTEGNPFPPSESPGGGGVIRQPYHLGFPYGLWSLPSPNPCSTGYGIGHTATSPTLVMLKVGQRPSSAKRRPW